MGEFDWSQGKIITFYGEVSLGGEWFPARMHQVDNIFVNATIIGSPKAQAANIIGVDITVGKERTKLLEEPEYMLALKPSLDTSFLKPPSMGGGAHRRRVSAIPNEALLPIKPF